MHCPCLYHQQVNGNWQYQCLQATYNQPNNCDYLIYRECPNGKDMMGKEKHMNLFVTTFFEYSIAYAWEFRLAGEILLLECGFYFYSRAYGFVPADPIEPVIS